MRFNMGNLDWFDIKFLIRFYLCYYVECVLILYVRVFLVRGLEGFFEYGYFVFICKF